MRPILKLFLPFLVGVLVFFSLIESVQFKSSENLSFFLFWFFIVVFGLYFISYILKKSWSWPHYLLWFVAGGLLVLLNQSKTDAKHFSFATADYFEVKVDHIHRAKSKNSKFNRCDVSVQFAYNDYQKNAVVGSIMAYIDTAISNDLKPNDILLVQAVPEAIMNQGNPGEFDLKRFWKTKGFEYQWFLDESSVVLLEKGNYHQSFFDRVRERIVSNLSTKLDADIFALALGILLGDKSYLNLELKDAFSGAGAMHLLAVSGLHVGIFLVILQWLFKTFGRKLPRWLRFLLIVTILWFYAGITGFSPSVNRAVTMFSFVALGTVLGRRYNSMDGLLASAMVLLVVNPYYIFDIGFQLSYAAMFGIFLFSPILERSLFIKQSWLKFIWSGTAVALAAQLTTFPITLYYFHQFPNYFLITNLGLMLISGVIMAIGLGLITLGSLPFIGSFIALVFVVVVSILITFVQWVSELPFAITRGFRLEIWEVFLLYCALALMLLALNQKRKLLIYGSLVLLTFFVSFQSVQSVQDVHSREFLVLNNNDPTFFIRRGKMADLVVLSNKPDIESRMSFLKRALDIYYGVDTQLHIFNRKNGVIRAAEWPFSFELKNALVHIKSNDRVFTYFYGDFFREEDLIDANHVLTGPWLSVNVVDRLYVNTPIWELKKQGAFRIEM